MKFKLPKLTTDVDCEPLGYPGLVVTFLLNPGYVDKSFPWDDIEDVAEQNKARQAITKDRPWEGEFFWGLSRVIESVTFPPEMTESGESVTVQTDSPKALHALMFSDGFDQNIITWAQEGYQRARQDWLKAEVKNSNGASVKP